jgi:acyloxyacyl hydrolase
MIVTGVADGRILYNTLKDKIAPIGVPYPVMYDFLNCLEISPCWGWMNSDAAARDGTTARAVELNDVYRDIIATTTFKNFDILYQDVPMEEIFARAESMGFTPQDCIEPVDGFHPSQLTNYLIA